MAGVRLHVVMPPELVESIDRAKNLGESRGAFVRRALEQALGDPTGPSSVRDADRKSTSLAHNPRDRGPAPARASSAALDRQALLNRSKGL